MKTSTLPRNLCSSILLSFTLVMFSSFSLASDAGGKVPPTVPVVSIQAKAPETREPFCDPAICDAALPAPGVFVITRQGGDLASELIVFLSYEGSASNGVDYSTLPDSVQFRAGAESVELFVEAAYDRLPEGDESVVARLQPDPSLGPIERYRLDPAQTTARVVIHDNSAPAAAVVSIEATHPIAEESSFPYRRLTFRGRFTISRTGSTDAALRVFVLYSGTATPDVDYPALPWLVTIPAGTNRIELDVVPTPDNVTEPIETIEAQLSDCPPVTHPPLGIPCYDVNIDPAHSTARVFIRDDGITTASLEITAPKDGATFGAGQAIEIAATAIDLEGAITHVDFFDADRKIGESIIVFFRQPDPGTPVYHEFTWTGAGTGGHELTARALAAAGNAVTSPPVRITVGDDLPVVSIEATEPDTTEPSPTTRVRPGAFTLRRTGDPTHSLRVFTHYSGSATIGHDYASPPTVVEFPAGASSVEVLVAPLDDDLAEGDESVIAELSPPPTAGLPTYRIDPVTNRARVTIHDNEPDLPVVSITAPDAFAREGASSNGDVNIATFVVKRSGTTDNPLTVRFRIGGTASNGVDYATLTSPLTIPAGQHSAPLVVRPLDDNRLEGIETVVVTLLADESTPPGYTLGTPRHAAAVIVDNEHPRPPCMRLADGLFNLSVLMGTNGCFRVEATGDFKAWTPLCTIPVVQGIAHFVDPDAAGLPHRFYRLVPVLCEPE